MPSKVTTDNEDVDKYDYVFLLIYEPMFFNLNPKLGKRSRSRNLAGYTLSVYKHDERGSTLLGNSLKVIYMFWLAENGHGSLPLEKQMRDSTSAQTGLTSWKCNVFLTKQMLIR